MRVIYKAALVFLLKDVYSKVPITTAVILCNGKQNPYTRKNDGYYVFSNLYPEDYNISIICSGHTDLNFAVTLKENETKVMTFDMPYTVDNPNLKNLTRFEITFFEHKKPVANTDITLKLKNEASFLKLVEPLEAGSVEIKLNIDEMLLGIIGQKYIYKVKRKEHEIYFLSYDQEKKCYLLKDPLSEKLEKGGKFYPVWNLKTDGIGRLTMPLIGQFMKDDAIKFECMTGDLKASVSFEVNGEHQSGKVFYANARLRQIEAKKANK